MKTTVFEKKNVIEEFIFVLYVNISSKKSTAGSSIIIFFFLKIENDMCVVITELS